MAFNRNSANQHKVASYFSSSFGQFDQLDFHERNNRKGVTSAFWADYLLDTFSVLILVLPLNSGTSFRN